MKQGVQVGAVAAAALACACASGPLVYAEAVRDGVAGVAGIEDPVAMAFSPDGAQVYIAGSGANAVAVFARDADTGSLRPASVVRDGHGGVEGLDQPGDLAFSPDGAHLYVAGFDADALVVFARDPARGSLRFVMDVHESEGGAHGLGGAVSVAVSPDGRFVYVAGREDDSLAVFARDEQSGRVRFVASERERGFGPTSLAISPDGRHVYVAGFDASAIAVYARAASGKLTRTATVRDSDELAHALASAASVAVSPDGGFVAAASYGEDALELFARDPVTGMLRRRATARAGIDAPLRLRRALGVAFAPSGEELYVASADPGSLLAFDVRDGRLRRAAVHLDEGAATIAEACAVAVSPDGEHVYVAGYRHSAIALFRRQAALGGAQRGEAERSP